MLVHPQFNPVALQLGPLAVRWYGLMYVCAFAAFILLGRRRCNAQTGWTHLDIDDILFWGVLGVVIGGRLGQVLFYEPEYYFSHPAEIIAVWKGGMSFHGGMLGVFAALWAYGRKTGRSFLQVGDFVGPLVPLGLMFGRIGNFINGELWGRLADPRLPWAMVFPQASADDLGAADGHPALMELFTQYHGLPRHPSQLYQAGMEGLLLFLILWWYSAKPRPTGAVSGVFLIGYGVFRFIGEFFRSPDAGIFGYSYTVSMGQWLSLPMILIGVWMFWRARSGRL